MSPRTGRPPKGKQSRTGKITIRISDEEAKKYNFALIKWIRLERML